MSEGRGVVVLGLGPGDPAHLTREAWQVLEAAGEVYLRTRHHPVAKALPEHLRVHSFDHLYETYETFEEVYEAIAQQVVELGRRPEGVVYAVPGHPRVGEASVGRLLAQAQEVGVPVRIVAGLSFIEPSLSAVGLDPLEGGLQVVDAMEVARRHHPPLDVDTPALIGQLYDRQLAADVKLTLMNAYPAEHPVTLVQRAGTPEERVWTMPLHELDRQQGLDDWTTLYVPPLPQPGSVNSLQDVVAHLRAPEGCPWDREQTHRTLRRHLLEETYEALTAIDAEDCDRLREELGDLLLQILMHVQMAIEGEGFRLGDVVAGTVAKLIHRHPHVFGQVQVADADEVLRNWETLKLEERKAAAEERDLFSGVATALPALAQAQEVQDRAHRVGWERPPAEALRAAIARHLDEAGRACEPEAREAAVGEAAFALVSLARELNVDAESALRRATARFVAAWREKNARGERRESESPGPEP